MDAVSMTEHLEYQPHKDDIPNPDRNKSFDIASKIAKPYELLVVKVAEITRGMPPGHNNAIFIKDANKLLQDDALTVFKANNQVEKAAYVQDKIIAIDDETRLKGNFFIQDITAQYAKNENKL